MMEAYQLYAKEHMNSFHELVLPSYRDISDAPILYTAIIEGIDVLLTGDKDFDDIEVDMPDIMTVAEFEKEYMLAQ